MSTVSKVDFNHASNETSSAECWSQSLDTAFKLNKDDSSISWQYMATPEVRTIRPLFWTSPNSCPI